MKRTICIILIMLMLAALCACGTQAAPTQTAAPAPTETERPASDDAPSAAEPPADADAPIGTEEQQIYVRFSSELMDGGAVDESIFCDHKLVMLNFWEPWCGPCVSEMPALQKLYESYADKGFLLIGVYSTEDGAAAVVENKGVKYPIMKYRPEFDMFQTGYVPNTIFVDGDGRFVAGPFVGGGSYEDWAAVVEALL